jgi:mitogen-activated protein kinase kinase
MKPDTISEESEEAAEHGADFEARTTVLTDGDPEVREWVIAAMDKRKKRIEEGIRGPEKPALHAAPLDAVPTPSTEKQVELGVESVTAGVGVMSTD